MNWISKWFRYLFYASNKPSTIAAISTRSLRSQLQNIGIRCSLFMPDRQYAIPRLDWLLHGYGNWYKKVLRGLKIRGWQEQFDCDDFARLYADLCQACHAVGNSQSEGIAVGKICYIPEDGGAHAINMAYTDEGIVFIEPQGVVQVDLTTDEIRSIYQATFW